MNPEIADLATAAASETDPDARESVFTDFAAAMQEEGPFVPLMIPGSNIASADTVDGAVYNSIWTMDIAELTPAS